MHYLIVSCPYVNDGEWQLEVKQFCRGQENYSFALMGRHESMLAGTDRENFESSWKTKIATVLENISYTQDRVGFVLINGGGVGCELERATIGPLIGNLRSLTQAELAVKITNYEDWRHFRATAPGQDFEKLLDQRVSSLEHDLAGCAAIANAILKAGVHPIAYGSTSRFEKYTKEALERNKIALLDLQKNFQLRHDWYVYKDSD